MAVPGAGVSVTPRCDSCSVVRTNKQERPRRLNKRPKVARTRFFCLFFCFVHGLCESKLTINMARKFNGSFFSLIGFVSCTCRKGRHTPKTKDARRMPKNRGTKGIFTLRLGDRTVPLPVPCSQVVRGELRTVLGPFGTGMALATFLAVCVLVVHWIGYGLLWDRHRQTAARLKKRSALGLAHGDDPWAADVGVAILKNLTTPEKQALMEEYWKMDDGLELRKMEWGAVRRFYRQTLDVQLTEEQVLGAVLCRRLRWLCP